MSRNTSFKEASVSYKQRTVSRDNHGQNIWDKLKFSCEIAYYEESSIYAFEEVFASIDKTFILGLRLGLKL